MQCGGSPFSDRWLPVAAHCSVSDGCQCSELIACLTPPMHVTFRCTLAPRVAATPGMGGGLGGRYDSQGRPEAVAQENGSHHQHHPPVHPTLARYANRPGSARCFNLRRFTTEVPGVPATRHAARTKRTASGARTRVLHSFASWHQPRSTTRTASVNVGASTAHECPL